MRELIILHAIRTRHATNKGIVFDLSAVKTDPDYWEAYGFLKKYSFLIEKVAVVEEVAK